MNNEHGTQNDEVNQELQSSLFIIPCLIFDIFIKHI